MALSKLHDGLKMAHFQKAAHSVDTLEKNWKYSEILCPYANKQGESLGKRRSFDLASLQSRGPVRRLLSQCGLG